MSAETMPGDTDAALDSDDTSEATSSSNRVRLPRVNLSYVVDLLEKAYKHGRSPSITQVSAAVDQPLNSGAFRNRMAAAAHFGLVEPARGRVQISNRGMRVLDRDQRSAALVEAWMHVPVFKSLFDRFDGNRLPPGSGIEAELRNLGVPSKNVAAVRRVLMSSAEYAGLLNSARDRLVIPAIDAPHSLKEGVAANDSHQAPRRPRSTDGPPLLLDYGNAGHIEVSVEIDWLALKLKVFGELRETIEKLQKLADLQRQPDGEPKSDEEQTPASKHDISEPSH